MLRARVADNSPTSPGIRVLWGKSRSVCRGVYNDTLISRNESPDRDITSVNTDARSNAGLAMEGDRCQRGRQIPRLKGAIDVLLSNGDSTFQTAVSYDSGGLSGAVAVVDVSSDGETRRFWVRVHVYSEKNELLVNNRFAYVSVSHAQYDAQICTNDGSKLSRSLSRQSSQRTGIVCRWQIVRVRISPNVVIHSWTLLRFRSLFVEMRFPVMQGNQTPQNRDHQPRQECCREQNGYIELHDVHDCSSVGGDCRCASAMFPNASQ